MNHNLNIATAIFAPSYRSLPELVMNRIKFYVENSPCMGSFMIRNLLKAEFPQQTFLERDVVNAIQHFKQDNFYETNDPDNDVFAQALLSYETSASYTWVLEQLLEANDGISPFVIISDADTSLDAALKTFLPFIKHVHCIFHIRQNLDRHIQRSLGKHYNSFLSQFYSKAQLDICLEYNAMLILMEEYEAFEKNDVQETDNLNIDDQVDFAQISLKSLIGKVNRTNIVEIWRITYLTHKQNSTSHFVILLHDEKVTNNLETNYNSQEQAFMDINGELSLMNPLTILSTLREDLGDSITNDINIKIEARHLYGNLFGIGQELCVHTNEIINESNRIFNPNIVKSKGRPRNNRFKSSVETHKYSNKNDRSVNSIQENDGQGSSQNNNSGSKACSNCNATSYNI
ncbi:unnamed protein product [Rhizophagus irregularis]|nr:unnamed protein product [Rhizophagus irregularis]